MPDTQRYFLNLYLIKVIMQGKLSAVLRILCVHIETSSLRAEFVIKNRCLSVCLVSEEVKSIKFDNFDNSHNSFLWPEYFIDFFMWKMNPMSGCNIRLVYTLPPWDSTLQYKRCEHFWNNFPCITFLYLIIWKRTVTGNFVGGPSDRYYWWSSEFLF